MKKYEKLIRDLGSLAEVMDGTAHTMQRQSQEYAWWAAYFKSATRDIAETTAKMASEMRRVRIAEAGIQGQLCALKNLLEALEHPTADGEFELDWWKRQEARKGKEESG